MNTFPTHHLCVSAKAASDHELSAYRRSQSLVLGVYEATDGFPRHAEDRLVRRLRELTTTISGLILEGCARLDSEGSQRAWTNGANLLEELAETLDRADALGFLHRDHMLELLELQSGALVDLLVLLGSLPDAAPFSRRRFEEPMLMAA